MSTNYYAVRVEPSLYNRTIHIGKSSVGWLFCFHSCDEFRSFSQFERFLDLEVRTGNYVLFNEYGEKVEPDWLIHLIDAKQRDTHCLENPDNFTWDENVDGYRFSKGEFS